MSDNNAKVWFITGCSTGFGRALAKHALDRGYRVVVTARDPGKVKDIVKNTGEDALVLKLDVNNPNDVKAAVKESEKAFGRIDVLVNNAGYGYLAAVEEGDEAAVRAMFETNYFGLVRMTQAVLPGMRARKSGHIVNISSIGGLVGFPSSCHYNATKFAVEGLSEALAKELEPLGIKVLIVEPGPFRTDWAGRSLQQAGNEIADYADTAGVRRRTIAGYSGNQPGDPVRAAEAIFTAVESKTPSLRLLLGRMALDAARVKIEALKHDFDSWEKLTLSADFPKSEAA